MRLFYFSILILSTIIANAGVVEITKGMPFVKVKHNGKTIKIERIQKEDSYLENSFALTSRPSPPFFIEPFQISDNVETYGELEVLDFISNRKGIFIDARLANWYKKSAIPSAVNIPFKIFLNENKTLTKLLKKFGGKYKDDDWDFTKAKTLLFYCNGAWCGQSPTAINALIEIGYPEEKMKYYRGGMQSWQLIGLTTIVPKGRK
ncbi:MAG: rhodanese-like domain-containing protein [Sulfurovum sp.]